MDIFVNGEKLELTPESPTPPMAPVVDINQIGEELSHGTRGELSACQGDCNVDADCNAGLFCYQRTSWEEIPGCSGNGTQWTDYCLPQQEGVVWLIGDNPVPDLRPNGLGLCEG